MKSAAKIIAKLRHPPAAHNWVRSIKRRRDLTAFALHEFALFPPRTSLSGAVDICRNIVIDGITLEQALKCVEGIKKPADRLRASWIVKAFYATATRYGWKGIEVFRDLQEYYPVAAGVRVPVRPTFVTNEEGALTPYFLICWAQMDFSPEQKALLSTLISEVILTLEGFENSDAVVICTPLAKHSKFERDVRFWRVSDFPLLTEDERQRVFSRYALALDDAEKMIIESFSGK